MPSLKETKHPKADPHTSNVWHRRTSYPVSSQFFPGSLLVVLIIELFLLIASLTLMDIFGQF